MAEIVTLFPPAPTARPHVTRPWPTPSANAIRVPVFSARFAFTRPGVRRGWSAAGAAPKVIAEELCLRLGRRPEQVWAGRDNLGALCLFTLTPGCGTIPRIAAWLQGALAAADLNRDLAALALEWDDRHPEGAA